ncbi:MAG: AsmA-like C-terminal region-containing protein [Bacteroidota bacterium]
MDLKQVYVKTPAGDEAVRQSTQVVKRNLRMVLVQVDGKLGVAELSAKIGNPRLVEGALRELEKGGFIAPKAGGVLIRTENLPSVLDEGATAMSQFSTFGAYSSGLPNSAMPAGMASQFSAFGKPILPVSGTFPTAAPRTREPESYEPLPSHANRLPRRWLFGISAGLLILALLLVVLYPYDKFKPELEAATGRLLQAPVRIGAVGLSLWPSPALVLSDIEVGGAGSARIEQLRLASPLALLGSGQHVLDRVDVRGATLPADLLVGLPLLQASGRSGQENTLIRQVHVDDLRLTAQTMALSGLSGDIELNGAGGMTKATLQNADLGLRLRATPAGNDIGLAIEGFGWQPFGAALAFNSLQATALLQKGKLLVRNLDTSFLNGIVKGDWLLDWSGSELLMAGDATLQRVDCRKMSAALVPGLALDGDLGGNLRLRANGKDWESLWVNVEASFDADITRGVLHGVDLGEVVRRGSGSVVSSGSTKFDRLRAAVTIAQGQVAGRDIQMSAGMVTASGQFVASRGRPLEASLLVTMQTSVASVRTPVRLSGRLPQLSAVSGK